MDEGERNSEMTPAVIKPKKPKTCVCCGTSFTPQRPLARACSVPCAMTIGRAKTAAKAAKVERAKDKETREKLKTQADWDAEAQRAVNAFVRARDAGEPCISCDTPWKPTFQAGHYRSRGSAKHLALDVRNINGQCVQCNMHKHSNAIEYRKGFIARYGSEFVEAIENDDTARHLSIDDKKAIRKEYADMTKQLKKERE